VDFAGSFRSSEAVFALIFSTMSSPLGEEAGHLGEEMRDDETDPRVYEVDA
jgi:hypothetical protein